MTATETSNAADVRAIIARPYARVLEREPDGRYSARVIEFPGCYVDGATPDDAIARLDDALTAFVEVMIEDGLFEMFPCDAVLLLPDTRRSGCR